MTTELLRHIASSRLPVSFHRPEDIEQVRALRAAGYVIALVPAPADPLAIAGPADAAQVLAITQKGREAVSYGSLQDRVPACAASAPEAVNPVAAPDAPARDSAASASSAPEPAPGRSPSRSARSRWLPRWLPSRILNWLNRSRPLDLPAQQAG